MARNISLIPLFLSLILAACGGGGGAPSLSVRSPFPVSKLQAVINRLNASGPEEMFGNWGFMADPTDPARHPQP